MVPTTIKLLQLIALKELGLDFSAFLDGPVVAEYYDKIAFQICLTWM